LYPTREAKRIAEEQGLDLVEIEPMAKPPVCRIIDYQNSFTSKKATKRTEGQGGQGDR